MTDNPTANPAATILVAEDEPNIRAAIAEFLRMEQWQVLEAVDGVAAKTLLEQHPVDVVVSDIRMPNLDGHGLLGWLLEFGPGVPVILMTAHGDVADAVSALNSGAADYIRKPFDLQELAARVRRCLRDVETTRVQRVAARVWDNSWFLPTEGPTAEAVEPARQAAPTNATVLIRGESGTGKEVVARHIHNLSPRRDGPFVAVNSGAIPEQLLESELFGHEKGAFSGATARRIGYFEAAQHGTLFLDEIGELPLHLQVKLLRAIQDRVVQRLGSTTPVPLDVRIIAATNRDLADEVAHGRFRQDLYYRIHVIEIVLPPLRERLPDLDGLIRTLLPRVAATLGVGRPPVLGTEAYQALRRYHFPGNIRELENMVERALIVSGGRATIVPADLGLSAAAPEHTGPPRPVDRENPVDPGHTPPAGFDLAQWEAHLIRCALVAHAGNRTHAAGALGIGRRTLLEKIARYHLD